MIEDFTELVGAQSEMQATFAFEQGKTKLKTFREKENNIVVVTSQQGGRGVDFVFQLGCLPSHVIINFEVRSSAALRQIIGRSCYLAQAAQLADDRRNCQICGFL